MRSPELENLVATGQLKRGTVSPAEIGSLVRAGKLKFQDATTPALSPESTFDLSYNAAHALALALLWHHGYRAANRYIVFQTLLHTAALPPSTVRILAKAHDLRNHVEYEGEDEIDTRLLQDLLTSAQAIEREVDERIR